MFAKVAKFTKYMQVSVQTRSLCLFSTTQSTKSRPNWPILDFEDQAITVNKVILDERVEDPRESAEGAKVIQKAPSKDMSAFSKYEQRVEKEIKKNINKIGPVFDNRTEEKITASVPNSEAFDPRSDRGQVNKNYA